MTTAKPEAKESGNTPCLPPICWVHRPHNLRGKIDEGEDLCPECCEKLVAKYKASDIIADGGWEQCRESEGLATCSECGCDLGCYLLDTFDDVAEWDDEDRCIDTPEKVSSAIARLAPIARVGRGGPNAIVR